MHYFKFSLFGALATGLLGCSNGQPRIYRVSIDASPLTAINNPSCYVNNTIPMARDTETKNNLRTESEFVIWSGADQVEYLDVGKQVFQIGNAPVITINELIEGSSTDKTFTAGITKQTAYGDTYVEARISTATFKFNDYSAVPQGTITLDSKYACQGVRGSCPQPAIAADSASCSSTLQFVARRIDTQQISSYGNNP
jgi:hypothetical protein